MTFRNRTSSPLLQLSPALHIRMQHAPRGISQPHLGLPAALLLEILPYTCKGSTRTSGTGETIHVPSSLFPDLWARGFVVRPGVGDIIKLIRPRCVGEAFGKGFCLVVVIFRVLVSYRGDWVDFRAEHSEEVDFFLTLKGRRTLDLRKGSTHPKRFLPGCLA